MTDGPIVHGKEFAQGYARGHAEARALREATVGAAVERWWFERGVSYVSPEDRADLVARITAALSADSSPAAAPLAPPLDSAQGAGASRFRKRPVVVEAAQWDGKNFGPLWRLGLPSVGINPLTGGVIGIETLEGEMKASPGDWIIRGVKGEFYPCKPDIFTATYEPADARLAPEGDSPTNPVAPERRDAPEAAPQHSAETAGASNALREALQSLVEQSNRSAADHPWDWKDHACHVCTPGGSMVLAEFRCARHGAMGLLARLAPEAVAAEETSSVGAGASPALVEALEQAMSFIEDVSSMLPTTHDERGETVCAKARYALSLAVRRPGKQE